MINVEYHLVKYTKTAYALRRVCNRVRKNNQIELGLITFVCQTFGTLPIFFEFHWFGINRGKHNKTQSKVKDHLIVDQKRLAESSSTILFYWASQKGWLSSSSVKSTSSRVFLTFRTRCLMNRLRLKAVNGLKIVTALEVIFELFWRLFLHIKNYYKKSMH